jgi:cell division protein FtsB
LADSGFLLSLIGACGALGALVLQALEHRRTARKDEVAYLQRQLEDLKRQNDLCELRCEELRDNVMDLLAQSGKRRRKPAAASV